jgi:hypothetical protein
MARAPSLFIITFFSLQFCHSTQAQDWQHQVGGGGGHGGAGWQHPVGQRPAPGWGGYGGAGSQHPVGQRPVPTSGSYAGYGGAVSQRQFGRYPVSGGGYGGGGYGGYGGYGSPALRVVVPAVTYAPDPDSAVDARLCSHLRWTCEHKEELGLEGAGTCRRYSETCE